MTYIGETYDILYRDGSWVDVGGGGENRRVRREEMLHNAAYLFVCASLFMNDAQRNSTVSMGNSFFLTGVFASSNHASNFPISHGHSRMRRDKRGE